MWPIIMIYKNNQFNNHFQDSLLNRFKKGHMAPMVIYDLF